LTFWATFYQEKVANIRLASRQNERIEGVMECPNREEYSSLLGYRDATISK